MASIEHKNLMQQDEREEFPLGSSNEVHLGEMVVSYERAEPGWRWAEQSSASRTAGCTS